MVTRQRSVPAGAKHEAALSYATPINVSVPSQPSPTTDGSDYAQTPLDPALLAQADALAKMTFELNMRTVAGQAQRLERDLQALVRSTSRDADFCQQHEARLQEQWREILAVKAHMSTIQGSQEDIKTQYERCQKETIQSVELFRREVNDLRGIIDSVSVHLDQLPTPAEIEQIEAADEKAINATGVETRAMLRAREAAALNSQKSSTKTSKAQSNKTPRARIQEALNSTRRWNRDHKNTALDDAVFATRYFKQQSKRDPQLAVFIQKAVQKRIRRRLPRFRSRPQTLEDFCKDVTWRDVLDTVDETLVKGEEAAARALTD